MIMIKIPSYAQTAIDILEKNGYSAHIVGGCVRDSLLGIDASDYDITTDALPSQVSKVFSAYHIIETGIKHGTVSVVIEKNPIEITTYRIDGAYKDNRRPEKVEFTDKLVDDLSRRDFTINAMAYNEKSGIIDYYNGKSDLCKKIIRCVGDADTRFNEDALRILRALRFASVLGFEIENEAKKSIHKNKSLLKNIAAERIQIEFFKLICGVNASKIVDEYKDVIAVFVPQIGAMFDFCQHSKYHIYDVWKHCVSTMENVEPELVLRLAALFHDIGKPQTFSLDDEQCGHFYAHAKKSVELVDDILNSLKCTGETKRSVLQLVKYHDARLCETKKSVKKWLGKIGVDLFFDLIQLQMADTRAHASEFVDKRIAQLSNIKSLADEVIFDGECFSKKDLAINGNDILNLGFVGKEIGNMLDVLLELVIEGEIENEKNVLLDKAKSLKNM